MGVVGLVVVWQLSFVVAPSMRNTAWIKRIFPEDAAPAEDEEQGNGSDPRRAIGYLSTRDRYTDDPRVTEEDATDDEHTDEGGNTGKRTIEARPKDVLPGERSNGGPAQPAHTGNEWADH